MFILKLELLTQFPVLNECERRATLALTARGLNLVVRI